LLLSVALNCSASSLLLLQGSIRIGSAKHCQAEMPDAMRKLFKRKNVFEADGACNA